jgi:UDP-N-acetylglucosamine 2-epimerase (non-hydrolysing)
LRDNTERPETLDAGSNVLAGSTPTQILRKVNYMLNKDNVWENPFGDGNAGKRIIQKLREKFD